MEYPSKLWSNGKSSLAVVSFFYFLATLFYFTRFAPLDPEVHHDGVMLTAAIAVSEGKIPNRDVFAQYGPLAPTLQGIWVYLTEPTLLSIREFTSLILAGTAVLMVILLSQYTSKTLSFLLATVWATSYPFFILPMNLPWSSVITTFIALLILILILKVIKINEPSFRFYIYTIFLTFLGCISIFGRLHMALTLCGIAFFSLCLNVKRMQFLYLKIWAGTVFITLFVIFGLMSIADSIVPYINQSILWAATRYVGNELTFSKAQIMEKLLLFFFPIMTTAFYFCHKVVRSVRLSETKKYVVFSLILLIAPISIWKVTDKSYLNPKYFLVSLTQNFTNWLGYSAVTFLLYLFVRSLIKKSLTRLRLAIGVYGISILTQLYPLHDVLHLYWITPVIVVLLAIWLDTDRSQFNRTRLATLKLILLPLLGVNLILSGYNLAMDRVNYQSDSVLRGMRGNPTNLDPIQKTIDAVMSASAIGSIEFNCRDGLYAVSGGRYLPLGPNFVNWGPEVNSEVKTKFVLACNLTALETSRILNTYKVLNTIPIDAQQTNVLYENQRLSKND
jgi:hypothetical protein